MFHGYARILRKVHLQRYARRRKFRHTMHVRVKACGQLVGPLNESQVPSQLGGHGPWFVCDVALSNNLKVSHGHDFGPPTRTTRNPKSIKISHGPWSQRDGEVRRSGVGDGDRHATIGRINHF